MEKEMSSYEKLKRRVFQIIEVGYTVDTASRLYDVVNIALIVLNIVTSVMMTYDNFMARFGDVLKTLEAVTVAFFAVDFVLRLWTSEFLYPNERISKAAGRYLISFSGVIDWLSVFPYYLPFFFPAGAATFRIFRLMRFFKLFRVNAYYDSLGVITAVLKNKRQQLFSSMFIIFIMMVASSLCMYSLEHEAQPDVFANAFSGIWWATSTLLTVGYGDIYPITPIGQLLAIFISFLGVGLVAIPTGIISAGFIEQQAKITRSYEHSTELALNYIKINLRRTDPWVGKMIHEVDLPNDVLIVAVQRDEEVIAPKKRIVLRDKDIVVLGARDYEGPNDINLKELIIKEYHPWVGKKIRDLDISKQTIVVGIKRENRTVMPQEETVLCAGDTLILYSKHVLSDAETVRI
ncbi:MAG: ion transporter [Lachnospiraceae bacterium]|nr:ion transporter [Lachnospiraceae bacterium]